MVYLKHLLYVIIGISLVGCQLLSPPKPMITPQSIGLMAGNPYSDKVVLILQGGPVTSLSAALLQEIRQNNLWLDALFVSVHQIQTLRPQIFAGWTMTFVEAKLYATESTKLAYEAINYFKDQGKQVIAVGISYGAFILQDMIASYNDHALADGYIFSVGRLNMPQKVWQSFAQGLPMLFKEGLYPIKTAKSRSMTDKNMAKLAAALSYKRYTDLLLKRSLQNSVYIFANRDEQVGKMSEQEIAFLRTKQVRIFAIAEAGHNEATKQALTQALRVVVKKVK